jgi:beta-lactam-binding protein with PASTA domain
VISTNPKAGSYSVGKSIGITISSGKPKPKPKSNKKK